MMMTPGPSCSHFLSGWLQLKKFLIAVTSGLLVLAGCSSLPNIKTTLAVPAAHAVQFDNANGALSAKKSQAILTQLKQKAGSLDILQKHLALEQEINPDNPLVLGNHVTLLQDGPSTYKAMFAAIRNAHSTINLESYIFEDGKVGDEFSALLLDRQAHGVQVNLIYDSVGSLGTPKDFFKVMTDHGIHVVEFNPVNPLAPHTKTWRLNNRDHRKLMVIDGKIAFVGGINISNAYSSGSVLHRKKKQSNLSFGWRDTHVEIKGPAVVEFQKLFLDTWQKQDGTPLNQDDYFPQLHKQGNEIVRAMGSTANDTTNPIYLTLLSAINHADRQIHLTNAYFVPDPQLLEALMKAAQRGVDVKLILPSHSDSWIVFNAGRSHYEKLLRAGVKIYERRGSVMHAKTATIDGVWSTIGSTNLDWRSFLHNDEVNAVILGSDFANQMEAMFTNDLNQSNQIDLTEWVHRPLTSRFKEWLSRLPEYWL
ncbi:MAG: cardiolipin synthase [Pseudomonadota bacterium]